MMKSSQPAIVSRIAPTPSGYLHIGNALNFLLIWLLVRFHQGILHLRIDDLDAPRVDEDCVEDIFRQLEWLGIDFDHGPTGPDQLRNAYSQQLKLDSYRTQIEKLKQTDFLYACDCTRSQIRLASENGVYPGICSQKKLDFETNKALRIQAPAHLISFKNFFCAEKKINLSMQMGDFIVNRKDGLPAYQIASLQDDLESQVNLIVRGEDLLDSTGAQIFLAECLGDNNFSQTRFIHHSLKRNESGEKISKSKGAFSIHMFREKHKTPVLIYQEAARWLGLPSEHIQNLEELLHCFRENFDALVYEKIKEW